MGHENAVRTLAMRTGGIPASDGAGVKLRRIIGSPELNMIDPFLLFDNFSSDRADDYIAGFPEHPHRGFETVTYMLAGRSRHKDSTGHEGVIETGDVQWMTAGSGIVHSEMPEQEDGLLSGFQLWVNLPAAAKMTDPAYQEYKAADIPTEAFDGGSAKVIAGTTARGTAGPVENRWTDPIYLDVALEMGATFSQPVPDTHNAFIYVIEGAVAVAGEILDTGELGVLSPSGAVELAAPDKACRVLAIAGRRLDEPVARGGPFVMNTKEEILQAFKDFQDNKFVATGKF
ncbi:MAG: pirin family protein [Alphaproteobacteria bacterium]|nr:pirin family protein [Alphaproteobacteria bacterium]